MTSSDFSSTVRGVLLDIEGTTSSISFVHDVMFPYVLDRQDKYLVERFDDAEVRAACQQVARDAGYASLEEWCVQTNLDPTKSDSTIELVSAEIRRLMAGDVKATGLKALQGLIWEGGFRSGELVAHVYPDVIPAITQWKSRGIDVRIYSSGSVAAQKLFFGHVAGAGDCLSLFSGHYDTTIGNKKEVESYRRIADDWQLEPSAILFVSDIAGELEAAQLAGLQTRASLRPGNAPLPATLGSPRIRSFDEVSDALVSR